MPKILTPIINTPFEREYEAWICRQIKDYYRSIGVRVLIVAFSPKYEHIWPADEAMWSEGKMVGLQFKRAELKNQEPEFDRLHWLFSKPPGQFEEIAMRPEIFYVLPTFINRDYENASLHHCLFWRPPKKENGDTDDRRQAYWENKKAQENASHIKINDARRWGLFYEELVKCTVGKVMTAADFQAYLANFQQKSPPPSRDNQTASDTSTNGGLYFLYIEHK
jgi:hypothetical protein